MFFSSFFFFFGPSQNRFLFFPLPSWPCYSLIIPSAISALMTEEETHGQMRERQTNLFSKCRRCEQVRNLNGQTHETRGEGVHRRLRCENSGNCKALFTATYTPSGIRSHTGLSQRMKRCGVTQKPLCADFFLFLFSSSNVLPGRKENRHHNRTIRGDKVKVLRHQTF